MKLSNSRALQFNNKVLCNHFSIPRNPQVKTFIMEDIARLSKEANLAYYEQVLCKSTIQRFLFFFQGERHLPAPGPLHSAVWSAQHQWCPHEAKTGWSFLLLILHVHPYLDKNIHPCTPCANPYEAETGQSLHLFKLHCASLT